jgi:cytochrome c biogenesis protein CcmG, thiol:disulfide interchange protein DsbE
MPDTTEVEVAVTAGEGRRRRIAPLVVLVVAVVLAALFVVLATGDDDNSDAVSTYLLDKPAPAIVGSTLDGRPFDLSRRKGSWVVLNFFNSTCVPCKAEHPELVRFAEQQTALGADGAELYTVVNNDSDEAVRDWFAEEGGDWPIVTDDEGQISTALGVAQVPETWIVDPDGTIVARFAGPTTYQLLAQTLQQLRGGAA